MWTEENGLTGRVTTGPSESVMRAMRQQAQVTLWMVAVRRRLADETDPAKRRFLAEMLVELNNRLPEKAVT